MADMVREIQNDPAYPLASDRALLVFESENDTDRIAAHLDFLKKNLPDVKVFGMTLLGKLKDDMTLAEDTTFCNLMLFKTSRVQVVQADTSQMTVAAAAEAFLDEVSRKALKGILFLAGAKSGQPSV